MNEVHVKLTAPILLTVACLIVACGRPAPRGETEAAAVSVTTARADVTDVISSFEAGGVVRARSTAAIASRVMAPILSVHVRPGARVHRGDTLVTLDARELNANRRRAAAALSGSVEAATAAESDIRAAEAASVLAKTTYDRVRRLAQQRSATTQELDQARSAMDAAEAQLAGTRARAAAAVAGRDAARETLAAANVSSSYSVLVAPFDGVVAERSADPGTMASPGVALLTVEDPSALRLELRLDEARAARIRLGGRADVQCDEGDDARHWIPARVAEIARVDPAAHSFLVKLDLSDAGGLRSGQFGTARFYGPSKRALTVPAAALIRRGQLTFVFTVASDGRATLQPISAGTAAGDRVEVLAGVREGDRVVLNPPAALSDRARIVEAAR
jgi:membrane fusion protein, multidrug efflux system